MRIYGRNPKPVAIDEFGLDANILKTRTIDLGVARTLECHEIGGTCLWGIEATNNTCYIDIRLNDQLRDPIRVRNGFFIRGVSFSRLYLTNPAQVGNQITLFFAAEGVNNIQVENPSGMYDNLVLNKSTVYWNQDDVNCAGGARTNILGGVPIRRTAFITNLLGGGGTLRIGNEVNVAANRGTPLALGETIVLSTTAVVAVWNPNVGACTICVTETRD